MTKEFSPPINSTVYDMVVNTYGDLNFLIKFCLDNKINNLNYLTKMGDKFTYDYNLVKDYQILQTFLDTNYKISTGQPELKLIFVEEVNINTEEPKILDNESSDSFIIE